MVLLKLGHRGHLEALRGGLLYMNTLAYFTSLESDAARGDPYEGTDSIVQPCDIGELVIDPHIPGLNPFRSHRRFSVISIVVAFPLGRNCFDIGGVLHSTGRSLAANV